ncbi:MAG: trigger factor, partial [Trueperella pyogenes]|nr:trigger factor [Trueperella pyogenes]
DENGNDVDVNAILGEKPEGEVTPEFTAKPAATKKAKALAEAPAESAAEAPAGDFDPAEHKVDEVLAYVESADDTEKARVLEAEKNGKARKTLITKLEA